jgi:hypothetical protein
LQKRINIFRIRKTLGKILKLSLSSRISQILAQEWLPNEDSHPPPNSSALTSCDPCPSVVESIFSGNTQRKNGVSLPGKWKSGSENINNEIIFIQLEYPQNIKILYIHVHCSIIHNS